MSTENGRRGDEGGASAREDRFPIVGMGASAGGLEALSEFFDNVPDNPNMAFVVVTHQHPGHTSLLPELVGRHTNLDVVVVTESVKVRPNAIYMAPPGEQLGMLRRELVPMRSEPAGRQLPIDSFFRSLAEDQKERAIGVVLSGTGTDGTLGLTAIKGAGGMIMAQAEASARYAGMPHSAIATELVDYVLPVAQMPAQLVAYGRGFYLSGPPVLPPLADEDQPNDEVRQMLLLLRKHTGHDFSSYKQTTIRRRIERRMNVHHVDDPAHYVRLLQRKPRELDFLFKELLIGVTSFFRDAEAFAALAEALVPLLRDKPEDYVVRVWVPGCSTGEEAYSIAILLREAMDELKRFFSVQIFATDLDTDAIDAARMGRYPDGIAADVSAKRLERFFVHDDRGYRIKKDVREMLVFAPQNLISDPPFTKLDLLSCRNLLIYLEGSLQRRLLPMFHYALRPGGILFLGTSETVGNFQQLFGAVDKKNKVFCRNEVANGTYTAEIPARSPGRTVLPTLLPVAPAKPESNQNRLAEQVLLRTLVPPSVLVHERGDVVHIHGRTGLFLEPSPGPQPTANIFNMARAGLQLHLGAAIREAQHEGEAVRHGVRVKSNGHDTVIDLRVTRIDKPEAMAGLLLVSFELVPEPPPAAVTELDAAGLGDERVAALARELQYTKESHQSTIEELETANEELKSTNEELQSTNEELQSANEELETSKEEMQSLNEELQTVNSELQGKVEELTRAGDDMKNLLNGTDIATIFLDNNLNIKRYTDQATSVIRLIPSDVGRPLGDLVSKLRYNRLVEDAADVLNTLVFKEIELRSHNDTWYLMRILPYRTTENVIDGLVLTFVDITKVKRLQAQADVLVRALQNSPTSIFAHDLELRVAWTAGGRFLGRAGTDVVGKSNDDLFSPADAAKVTDIERRVIDTGVAQRERVELRLNGAQVTIDFYAEPWRDADGEREGVICVITELDDETEGGYES